MLKMDEDDDCEYDGDDLSVFLPSVTLFDLESVC